MRFEVKKHLYAAVAELADAQDSGSCARTGVKVQVLSAAPVKTRLPGIWKSFCFALNLILVTKQSRKDFSYLFVLSELSYAS